MSHQSDLAFEFAPHTHYICVKTGHGEVQASLIVVLYCMNRQQQKGA